MGDSNYAKWLCILVQAIVISVVLCFIGYPAFSLWFPDTSSHNELYKKDAYSKYHNNNSVKKQSYVTALEQGDVLQEFVHSKIEMEEKLLQANVSARNGIKAYNRDDMLMAILTWVRTLGILNQVPGTEREKADCHALIGEALKQMELYGLASVAFSKALAIFKDLPEMDDQTVKCYLSIGIVYRQLGRFEQAIGQYKNAIDILENIPGSEYEKAACCMNIGVALLDLGKYKQAVAWQKNAFANLKKIPGTEGDRAGCYMNIGLALEKMGHYEQAIARHKKALAMFQQIPDTEHGRADCHKNIGGALEGMGRYRQAIARHKKALAMFQQIPYTKSAKSGCFLNVGNAFLALKAYPKAIETLESAALCASGWRLSRALGKAYRGRAAKGDLKRAVDSYLDAMKDTEALRADVLAFEHRAGFFEKPAQVYGEFARFLTDMVEKGVRIENEDVLQWTTRAGAPEGLLDAAFHYSDRAKGRALLDAMRERAALSKHARRAGAGLLAEDKALSLQIGRLQALRLKLPKDRQDRRKELAGRIRALQQRRNQFEVELKRTALGAYVSPEWNKPMDTMRRMSEDTAVLQYSVGREECLLLLMTHGGVSAHRLAVQGRALPELLPRQQASRGELLDAWEKRRGEVGLDGLVRLARMRVEDLARDKDERRKRISAAEQEDILKRLGEIALPAGALKAIRQRNIEHLVVILDGALHYIPFAMLRVPGPDGGDGQYLLEQFSISYTPSLAMLETVRRQAVGRAQQRKHERRSFLAFANPDFGGPPTSLEAEDGFVTRVMAIRRQRYADQGLRLLPLPGTEKVALGIAEFFGAARAFFESEPGNLEGGSVVFAREGACESRAKQILGSGRDGVARARWKYLLFATHGQSDNYNGMLSCLALSKPSSETGQDGFLLAQEVLDLKLDTDLVMLSACQTGLGRMRRGEGLTGLSTAFFIAGAESVCASLWQVPTEPTSMLTEKFFQLLKDGDMSRAEALRQAQLAVLDHGRKVQSKTSLHAEPFCWAAFELMGEYRRDPTARSHASIHRKQTVTDQAPAERGNALHRMQAFLKQKGLYEGDIDGAFGERSWAALQRYLKTEQLYAGAIDGQPGPVTIAALKQMQRQLGVPRTGHVDFATVQALEMEKVIPLDDK